MTRHKKEQLQELKEEERVWLEKISRSQSEASGHVIRAKQILGVAAGQSYTEAAHLSGCKSGDTVSNPAWNAFAFLSLTGDLLCISQLEFILAPSIIGDN
jgi:hypothetical protein